jgi:hypothetical protein
LKYSFDIPGLFLAHTYSDQSKDAWTDGVTPIVGVKAMIGHFTADLHQRAQETTITTAKGVKTIIHKKFYAVEVVLVDTEMRALLAIFSDPLKLRVPLESSHTENTYRTREDIPTIDMSSPWADLDDFKDPGWDQPNTPKLHALPMVTCPRFTYFKRRSASASQDEIESTKFGEEDSHVCFLGKEPCTFVLLRGSVFFSLGVIAVPKVQMGIVSKRIDELRDQLGNGTDQHALPSLGAEVCHVTVG